MVGDVVVCLVLWCDDFGLLGVMLLLFGCV